MSRKEKILISIPIIIFVSFFGWLGYLNIFHAPQPYGLQVEGTSDVSNTNAVETSTSNNTEELEVKEKTLEEKEREIESKKPRSKIAVDLLKDTSNATVDDTLATLPDAPLYYKVDGIDFKLKENPEKIENFTKELMEDDIKRLQSYGYNWYTGYVNEADQKPNVKYGEYYERYPDDTSAVIEKYIPQRLNIFKDAIVGWVTNPNLVYDPANTTYGISGVIQLSYFREDNMYDLEPYKLYERDVEFRYANTTDGLFLRQVIFLSDWKEVISWENPYK